MTVSKDAIEAQLLAITHEFLLGLQAERAARAISINASLERELGIGSLSKVELFQRIENAFSVHLQEAAIANVDTLKELVPLIEKALLVPATATHIATYTPLLKASSLDISAITIMPEIFKLYHDKEPDRPHIYLQDESGAEQIITYGQLFKKAMNIARGLHHLGIKAGETVAIMLPTSDAFFYSFAGILLAGAIPVPIYPPFRPDRIEEYIKREAHILHNAEVRALITFSQATILTSVLQTFIPSLKAVTTVNELAIRQYSYDYSEITTQQNDIALIQYTSGSTGDPKGIVLTHTNILSNIRGSGNALHVKPSDSFVSWLPLYHDMGLMSWLGSLYFGVPITILSPLTFLTRPEKWLWTIHYHAATLSGGPNFAYELCVKKINPKDIEGLDLRSWRFAFNGAEAISPKTLENFSKQFAPYGFKAESFAPVYGLAEATVGLCIPLNQRLPRIDKIERKGFEQDNKAIPIAANTKDYLAFVGCGTPLAEHHIRIVDNDGIVMGERTVGNLQFKGPSAMQGYFNNPSATQAAFHESWWDTGDLAYIVDNEVFIVGRKKDIIIKAGRNISPVEIEEVVNQIDHIRKGCSIAFGVSDQETGTEKLVVVAETYEKNQAKKQQIYQDIIEKMSSKIGIPPDTIVLVAPHIIPKTSSGKLQRSLCKEYYVTGKLAKEPLSARLQFVKLAFIALCKKTNRVLSYAAKIAFAAYIGIILFLTLPLMLIALILLPKKWVAKTCQIWARNCFRLCLCPITIKNKDELQTHSPVIYVANHASYLDSGILLGILPPSTIIIGKKELLKSPIIKTFIKKLGFLTVDRMDFANSVNDIQLISDALKEGQSILIFPEGTFTYATGLRPFKLGAFTLAEKTNTPICPISLKGTRNILRGDSLLPKPGHITITIGKLISPNKNDTNTVLQLYAKVRSEIAKSCGEPAIDVMR